MSKLSRSKSRLLAMASKSQMPTNPNGKESDATKSDSDQSVCSKKVSISQDSMFDLNGNKKQPVSYKKVSSGSAMDFDDLISNFSKTKVTRHVVSILKYGHFNANNGRRSVTFNLPDGHVDKLTAKCHSRNRQLLEAKRKRKSSARSDDQCSAKKVCLANDAIVSVANDAIDEVTKMISSVDVSKSVPDEELSGHGRNPGFIIQLDGSLDDISDDEENVQNVTVSAVPKVKVPPVPVDDLAYNSDDDFKIVFEDSDFECTTPKTDKTFKMKPLVNNPGADNRSAVGIGKSNRLGDNPVAGPSIPFGNTPVAKKTRSANAKAVAKSNIPINETLLSVPTRRASKAAAINNLPNRKSPPAKKQKSKGRSRPVPRKFEHKMPSEPTDLNTLNAWLTGENPIVCIGIDPNDFSKAPGFVDMLSDSKQKYIATWSQFVSDYDIKVGKPPTFGEVYQYLEKKFCKNYSATTITSYFSHINMAMTKIYHRNLGERKDIFK